MSRLGWKAVTNGPGVTGDDASTHVTSSPVTPPGVPYVRGWARARRSAGTLADQLVLLGLDSDFPGLMADVNVSGGRVGAARDRSSRSG